MTDGSTIARAFRRIGSWVLEDAIVSLLVIVGLIGGIIAAFWLAERLAVAWIIIGALFWIAIVAVVFTVKRSR